MKKPSIYISIPMTGYDETIQRTKADIWKRYWEERGYEVVNHYDLSDMLKASYENIIKREPTYAESGGSSLPAIINNYRQQGVM